MTSSLDQPARALSDLSSPRLEVFFDGECPLCRREIALLRRWDRRQIRFVDIAAEGFDPRELGIDQSRLMAEIHGRLADGRWIRGVEVFRQIYDTLGWGAIVAVTRWPGVRRLLDWLYAAFARNRLRLTGRCDSSCRV